MKIHEYLEKKRIDGVSFSWHDPDYKEKVTEQNGRFARCFTSSRTRSLLTIGNTTIVMYYDNVIATIHIQDKGYTLVRHTSWEGDAGLTSCINSALYVATNRCYTHVSSRDWKKLPVVPFEEFDTDKINVEPYRLYNLKGYRTVLTYAILMADDDDMYTGKRLLESLDDMVKSRHTGVRYWYSEYTLRQIDAFINKVFKDTEVPSYY